MRSQAVHQRVRGFSVPACAEPLEPRRLLAATQAAGEIPSDLLEKLDTRVWSTSQRLQQRQKNTFIRHGTARVDSTNRLELDIVTKDSPARIARRLRALGARVTEILTDHQVIEAFIPAARVANVARMSGVSVLRLPDYSVTSVVSDGDYVLLADRVRTQFSAMGITGAGIKVGVISNGVNHRADVGAELPGITIDPARPGNGDEGTAMLEIVHDLAPGAQLYFSGPATSTAMVSSINYLVGQGCDVIIDDLFFPGEPYFADGPVANAAANAVTSGVVYVTAAGNYGNQTHYQAPYVQSATSFGGGRLHQLATGDDSNNVTIPGNTQFRAFLQWSDPFSTSNNDYDLYLIDSISLATLASSTVVQNGTNDNPLEFLDYTNPSAGALQAEIWIVRKTGAAVRELELFTLGNTFMQFNGNADGLVGQQAVASVMSVATSPWFNPTNVASYSSRGGSTVYTNFASQTKTTRQTLDGTAVDVVETRVGQLGFFSNPFAGTSAAAPHAGAIAALILQAAPSLTPAQVLQTMADTAVDLGAVGYDTTSGAGLYSALDAIYKLYTPGQPDMVGISDLGMSSTDNLTADTVPIFTGTVPAASHVRLYVDGVNTNSIQLAPGITTYALDTGVSLSHGPHAITIRVSAGASVLLANNSVTSPALNITIDAIAPEILTADFIFTGPTPPRIVYTFSESVAGSVQASDLSLHNLTTATTISPASMVATNSPGTSASFIFPGFKYGALPDGIYLATVTAPSMSDAAGNVLESGVGFDFFSLAGDANRDGRVDSADLGILSLHWQGTGKTFAQGDFTYDGIVNVNDLGVIGINWLKDLFA